MDEAHFRAGHEMSGDDTMQHDAQRKAFVTLQARAALIGAELYPISTGGYLLLRWSMSRELDSLAEVEALLAQMGAPRASS